MSLRALHTYIGMFIAPCVLFLSLTGLLQVYSLHEAHGDYTPAPLIEKLSSVHKDQVFRLGHHGASGGHKAAAVTASAPPPAPDAAKGQHEGPKPAVAVLKAFFALVAVSLAVSTLIGVWMGLQQPLRRRNCLILLVAGTLIPVLLIALGA